MLRDTGVSIPGSGRFDRRTYLVKTDMPGGDSRDDRNTDQLRELANIDFQAFLRDLIHEVQHNHHRDAHICKLKCQEEIALQMHCVHNIDDEIGFQNDVSGNSLFVSERRDSVDAGRVEDDVRP